MAAFRRCGKMDFQASHELIGLVAYPRDEMPCLMRLRNLRRSFRAIRLKQQIYLFNSRRRHPEIKVLSRAPASMCFR